MPQIAVLISGGGSNLQSIIDSINCGSLNCKIECVISDRPGVYGLERAKVAGIDTYVLDRKIFGDSLSREILKILYKKVDLIVLAGFLSILKGEIISAFRHRIINIHPSLIPSFCGSGMYGLKVHQKALETGVKVSGCTVHFVDEGTDSGPIIFQKVVPVFEQDDAKTLQERILIEEHTALPEAVKLILENKIKVIDNKVYLS